MTSSTPPAPTCFRADIIIQLDDRFFSVEENGAKLEGPGIISSQPLLITYLGTGQAIMTYAEISLSGTLDIRWDGFDDDLRELFFVVTDRFAPQEKFSIVRGAELTTEP
jgi:hypothetical protein